MLEDRLRDDLIEALTFHPYLSANVGVVREAPTGPVTAPMIAIAASASRDWSTKTERGAEVRVAIEFVARGDAEDTVIETLDAIEAAALGLPAIGRGYRIVTSHFLRARSEKRSHHLRSSLLEFRFLLLAQAEDEGGGR